MEPVDTRQARKELNRQKILSSAQRLFARKGYESTALEEVARASRLAKGTLYLYFRDKEDLYYHAVVHVLERLEKFVLGQLARSRGPLGRLRGVARGQILFFARNRDLFRLFTQVPASAVPGLHKRLFGPLLEKRQELEAYLSQVVEEGKREGLFRRDLDTAIVVGSFVGMTNHAVQTLFFATGAPDPEGTTDALMKILLEGISQK
jgi:TetR/AcrR family fatty acid metabolism transcriptional regulator